MASRKDSAGSKARAGKKAAGKRAERSGEGRGVVGAVPAAGIPGAVVGQVALENERANFARLVAANPNHFGNLTGTQFKPAFQMAGNVKYEELSCVGFNPQLNTLEATVKIKLPNGYGGPLCSPGSNEYVRFYVDYGAGGGWEDLGLAGFDAHDIPNTLDCARLSDKPHCHVVSLPFQPRRDCCRRPVLPRVRAILSWNQPPPANTPNWNPAWGQVKDRTIQISPRPCTIFDWLTVVNPDISFVSLLEKVPELQLIKDTPIPVPPEPPELSVTTLAKLYGMEPGKRSTPTVEPHRFAMTQVQRAVSFASAELSQVTANASEFASLGLNFAEVVGALTATSNNVTYEQLDCVGLDNNSEWLVGTFTLKKQNGYSGSLCRQGSKEYVAFWADWEDKCQWEYLGTVAVEVHDIPGVPNDGLRYSAVLPVSLGRYRRPCNAPRISRVRGVLSWNTPPSTTDPNALPYWGNRVDVHVQIKPGEATPTDRPSIHTIGGVIVNKIDHTASGLTLSDATFGQSGQPVDGLQRPCPFGGIIQLTADVPQEFSGAGLKYRIVVRRVGSGGPAIPVMTPFFTSSIFTQTLRTPDANGYVNYLPASLNYFKVLGAWNSHAYGFADSLWEVRVEMVDASFNPIANTAWHRVQLDNTAPVADITIDLDNVIGQGECKDFTAGDTVKGHFTATDLYFGSYTLRTRPASMSPPNPSPSGGTSPTNPSPGNEWTLNTNHPNMKPCGYVVVLEVRDRSIVNSTPGVHNHNSDDEGFCLRAAE